MGSACSFAADDVSPASPVESPQPDNPLVSYSDIGAASFEASQSLHPDPMLACPCHALSAAAGGDGRSAGLKKQSILALAGAPAKIRRHRSVTEVGGRLQTGYSAAEPTPAERAARITELVAVARRRHPDAAVNPHRPSTEGSDGGDGGDVPPSPVTSECHRVCAAWLGDQNLLVVPNPHVHSATAAAATQSDFAAVSA